MTREDFLASVDDSASDLTTKTVYIENGDSSISWGLIVPIILIALFLVGVAVCLYWRSFRHKNARSTQQGVDRSVNTSFERFSRGSGRTPSGVDYVRASIRSTTPLNIRDKVNVVPLTSENPGQFKFYWDKDNWKLCPPDHDQAANALAGSRSSLLRQHLSPIDELESPTIYADSSRSFEMEAQPPYSPYHLTWPTPKAPPPSYEESELSCSPEKSAKNFFMSTTGTTNTCSGCTGYSKSNLTNNSGYTGYSRGETTDMSRSGYTGYSKDNNNSKHNTTTTGYSKSMNSPFYPNNNTPNTDIEFLSEQGSLQPRMGINVVPNPSTDGNSRFTSYQNTPISSLNDLSESNVDTLDEISYRRYTGSMENFIPGTISNRNSQYSQYIIDTDHNRNSRYSAIELSHDNQYNVTTGTTRHSQYDEDFSMGVPSLPSSIIHYHQRLANNNVVMSGKVPQFSPHAFPISHASSLESSDTNYTDNTSMLPCVGSSITSGNPTGITQSSIPQHSIQNSEGQQHTEVSEHVSPEDLSKIVDELSSIRPGSNEPPSVNRGVINSMCLYDGATGHSYVADICPPQHGGALSTNINQSLTELFRSWSVTAELDYSSISSQGGAGNSMQTPLNEGSFSWDTYPMKKSNSAKSSLVVQAKNDGVVTDVNHNVVDINQLPGKNVQFAVPVLVDKTYWV